MIFDVNNLPAVPNPYLDSDLATIGSIVVQGGQSCNIAAGDWVGLDPIALPPDPLTGTLFQVTDVYAEANQIEVLVYAGPGVRYAETRVSGSLIRNVFRHQTKV